MTTHFLKMPLRFYVIATDFGPLGVDAGGDLTTSRDKAYDQFVEHMGEDRPSRAFMVDMDPDTGLPEATTDITEEFAKECATLCAKRGYDIPVWAGGEPAPYDNSDDLYDNYVESLVN